jgi:virginiamycin B lyase
MVGVIAAGAGMVLARRAEAATSIAIQEYPLPRGSRPHDVACAPDGSVWYTAQATGHLGRLDPTTGAVRQVKLGDRSSPHGVIVAADGGAWVTDGGLNAMVRVDPDSERVDVYKLPGDYANLNTAAIDRNGVVWFTGQSGVHGRVDPNSGQLDVWPSPKGRGPYGIANTPTGEIYFVSLAGSYLASVNLENGAATVLEPPTSRQGARRVWSDSSGNLWISEWDAGQLGWYSPSTGQWREWKAPGAAPKPYAVYVDDRDAVWISDFATNQMVRFDPPTETFEAWDIPSPNAQVRQILGRPGEVWGAESGTDKLLVLRYLA